MMAAQPYTGKDGSAGRVVKGCRGFVWRVDRLCCTPVRRSLEENSEEGKKKKRKPGRRKKKYIVQRALLALRIDCNPNLRLTGR